MTYLTGYRPLNRGKDRLIGRINTLLIGVTSMALAGRVIIQGKASPFKKEEPAVFESSLFPLVVVMPMAGVLETALQGNTPELIGLSFQPKPTDDPYKRPNMHWVKGKLHDPTSNLLVPIFVEFFETHKPWLYEKFGKINAWPPIFDFARVIRNALSHGGSLHMIDAKAKDVEWHQLKYGLKDHDRNIYLDFGPGDFIILMFEMSDELDKHDCPIDPPDVIES